MTEEKKPKEDLRPYRPGPLTVLQLLALVAILGLVLTWVVKHFFK